MNLRIHDYFERGKKVRIIVNDDTIEAYEGECLSVVLFISNKKNSKLLELKKYFENLEKPKFPIKAKIMMEKYNLKEGKELGQKLKSLENLWVENNFNISEKEVENTFLN